MKIVDEKGRVFGKINIIDFIILIFLISLMPIFYYGYRLFYSVNYYDIQGLKDIEVMGIVYDISPEILSKINRGDKDLDANRKTIAEIIDVGKLEKLKREVKIGKESIIIEDTGLNIKLRLRGKIKDNSFLFKNEKILDYKPFNFTSSKYSLEVFLKKHQEGIVSEKIKVRVFASKILNELAFLISVGDKEYKILEQGKEFVLGEIISIISSKPSKGLLFSRDKEEKFFMDSPFRDVELILALNIEEWMGGIFYKNIAIKVGNSFIFRTTRYNLNCIVLEILEQ